MKQEKPRLFFGVQVTEQIALNIQDEIKHLYLGQEGGVFLCRHEKTLYLGRELETSSEEEINLLKKHIETLLPHLLEDPSQVNEFRLFER